jgi:hypothetical protein
MNQNSTVTEAQVVEFLAQRAGEIRDKTGRALCSVELYASAYNVTCGGPRTEIKWRVYADGVGAINHAPTLAVACEQVLAQATPENIAAKLRAEAFALIAKADALSAAPAPSAN